jgi:hypothetical protein
MGKTRTAWVLDTETKGTGAEMVPLERLEERKALKADRERLRVVGPRAEPVAEPVEADGPRIPRRFKIVNVLTRQVLAENAGITEALRALRGVNSIVDVNVYVWDAREDDWRPLRLSERRALWGLRDAG